MSEKKKSILGGLFKSSGGCGCGVKIVEDNPKEKNDSSGSTKEKKK